jgi:sulfonate transport system substrate-binding protein
MPALLTPEIKSTTKTKFSYTRCPGVPTISAVAAPLGYLVDEFANDADLDVTHKQIGFTGKTEWAHEDRFWIRNAGHAPAIWGRAKGVDSKVVALAWLEGTYPVVALAASGIQTVAELKGKRLGLVRAKDSLFDLQHAGQLNTYTTTLSTAGLSLDDVKLIEIDRPKYDPNLVRTKDTKLQASRAANFDLAERLNRGEFDAIAVQSAADIGEFTSVRVLYDVRNHPDQGSRVHPGVLRGVVVSGPLLRERRDLVVRALARLLQAGEWAKAHPEELVTRLAENYDIYPEVLTGKYENLSEGVQIDLAPEKIAALKYQKDFLLKHHLIENDFDVEPWVDHGPLAEARVLYADWKKSGKIN